MEGRTPLRVDVDHDVETARSLLRVPASATPADVERCFRRLARELHPDQGGDAESFRVLLQAREILQAPRPDAAGRRPPLIVVHRDPWWRGLLQALGHYIKRRPYPPPSRVN